MVAKIKSGKSLKGALAYNEIKVADGRAKLLDAVGYSKDPDQLSFQEKLFRLSDLAGRNQRVRTNTVHISLNFDTAERLPEDTLTGIAVRYMDGIGFGDQPFLVYQHYDAGHPHIHILTTNIDRGGSRISLHDLGRTRSEDTRKAIEVEYGLKRAQDKLLKTGQAIAPVKYGKAPSKTALDEVVHNVINGYRFTSLPELNAVLQAFNVLADRGSKASTMYRNNGLRYWITDNKGNKIGTPLKASMLRGRPTLKLLGQRFQLNEALRRSYREQVRSKVDQALGKCTSIDLFERLLAKDNISTVIRRTDTGMIYGMTLVDHQLKVVFNGSDLGKSYAAAALSARLTDHHQPASQSKTENAPISAEITEQHPAGSEILNALFEKTPDTAAPAGLRQKRKKKKRLNL